MAKRKRKDEPEQADQQGEAAGPVALTPTTMPQEALSSPVMDSGTSQEVNGNPEGPDGIPAARPIRSIRLGSTNDSPRMQLLRSEQFQQMQIQFDEKPAEVHRTRLREAGWKYREQEKVWTVQFEKGARWRTQANAEKLFDEIGYAIRVEQGIEPVAEIAR